MNIREQNRLSNIYRREAQAAGIVSPYRQSVYINARLKGKSQEKALSLALENKPKSGGK